MKLIGEVPRQFIADLKEDPTRLKNRAWDAYSEEVRNVCNYLEILWMKAEIEKLRKEYVKTLGAVLKLDEEAARNMMGLPSYKSQIGGGGGGGGGSASVAQAQQSQLMQQQQMMQQAYANNQAYPNQIASLGGKGMAPPTYATTTTGKI
jgi:hypothetical protein